MTADHPAWLAAQSAALLEFGRGARLPEGGFGLLDDRGRAGNDEDVDLLITCRMTHVFALGVLLGHEGAGELVDHGMAALRTRFADRVHGGWFQRVRRADGTAPERAVKDAYTHAFVLLAAASAVQSGHPDGPILLDEAIGVVDRHFWDEEAGWVTESWDAAWTTPEPYRGANSNMHSVEAFLAVHDATGESRWLERALRIAQRLINTGARGNGWRILEHFQADGTPDPEYNVQDKAHQYRPYGATIGHALEWSRLLLHLRAALGGDAPEWLLECSLALFDTAVAEGWAVDGAEGFVYTTDWAGRPVVRERLHWVIAEAIGAAAARWQVTGAAADAERYHAWWAHVAEFFLDREHGSWFHELDTSNRPAASVWAGKPDLYHALQTTLIPRLPLAPSLTAAVASGLLDTVSPPPAS